MVDTLPKDSRLETSTKDLTQMSSQTKMLRYQLKKLKPMKIDPFTATLSKPANYQPDLRTINHEFGQPVQLRNKRNNMFDVLNHSPPIVRDENRHRQFKKYKTLRKLIVENRSKSIFHGDTFRMNIN